LPSAFWQAGNICLNFLAFLVNVCAFTALTSLWF
jgi:hypothetical protein